MNKIDLTGPYKLKYYEYGTFQIQEAASSDFYPNDWLETIVPEDVRTVLRRYGYIEGHYYGKDLNKERWIEEKDWIYYRSFSLPKNPVPKKTSLYFEGIDTISKIWINGIYLGMSNNMFLEYSFDVTQSLLWGEENHLVVQVLSPVKYTEAFDRTGIYPKTDTTRLLLRKSQMNWGWDFCGHCLTTGIWKPVTLKCEDHASLKTVLLATEKLHENKAMLHLQCEIQGKGKGSDWERFFITLEFMGDGPILCWKFSATQAACSSFFLEDPRPWWPRPYGEPFLYKVRVRLYDGANLLDEKNFRFGIRTIQLIQERDGLGRSFLFSINGKRIFIRGANWVPLNCIYGEIRDEDYEQPMKRVVDSHISMLRIWGGGIYEAPHFLDLCDENGIMVFQDMMLACGIYPQDDAFLQTIYEEAKYIVRQNYNRACIVLWSADNELDEAYRWEDLLEHFRENKVNRLAVKEGVTKQDPYRPFLVSSPASPFEEEKGGDDPNSDLQGDMHLYLTRFEKDQPFYYKKLLEYKPRFMSEFGFSSCFC